MSQNRTPAGVPTGGQFAASAHTESSVSLASPASQQPSPAETARTAAHAAIAKIQRAADRLTTVAALCEARDKARERFGAEAAYLAIDENGGDEDDTYINFTAYRADGTEIESVDGAWDHLRADIPDALYAADRHEKGFPTYHVAVLDMAALDGIDLAREVRTGEMALANDTIGRNAVDSFVLDEAVINEQIDAETGFGTFDDYLPEDSEVTDEERALIAAEFRASAVDFEPVINDFHTETQRAARTVLERTRIAAWM